MSSSDKATDVVAACAAKSDELASSARLKNTPVDGKAVSHGPLVTI